MYQRIVRGISLSFVFIVLGSLFGYFFRKILTIHLSVAEYGLFFSVLAFYSFFMLFIDLGLEQAATKYIVEYRLQQQFDKIRELSFSILFFQFIISLFFYLFILFFSDFLAAQYFHSPLALPALQLLGIWFLTTPFILFLAALLLGFQRTTWYTALDFFRMTILLLCASLLFFFDADILAPLLAYAFVQIILFLCYLPYVLSFFPSLFHHFRIFSLFDRTILCSVLSYGIFIAFTNFGWVILTQTDTFFLTYFTSLEAVGLYNVALPISLLILFFMRPFIIVFSPLAVEFASKKKYDSLQYAITTSYTYLFFLLLPFVLIFLLFSDSIITLLFSSEYLGAIQALKVLSVGTLFYSFSLFNGVIFTGLGKVRTMASFVAIVAFLNVFLLILFVPQYGIIGAALSTSFSYILLFLLSTVQLHRLLSFSFPFSKWFFAFLFSLISLFVVISFKNIILWNNILEAFVSLPILFITYISLLFVFRVLDIREMQRFIKCFRKDNA